MTRWNYGASYRHFHRTYPKMPVLYSESASAVSEYGFYEQPPAVEKTDYARDTLQVGSYDHNAAGVRDPLSSADVRFALEGPGEIMAVGNGNPKDHKSFTDVSHHPLHYGKAVAVVRRLGPGTLVLKASAAGLAEGRIELK